VLSRVVTMLLLQCCCYSVVTVLGQPYTSIDCVVTVLGQPTLLLIVLLQCWVSHTLASIDCVVTVLGQPYTCFDAKKYSMLFIVDSEDVFSAAERQKLQNDVDVHGLSLVVIAEWYDVKVMRSVAFNDDNTRRLWHVSSLC
jgi:hypothetical protein